MWGDLGLLSLLFSDFGVLTRWPKGRKKTLWWWSWWTESAFRGDLGSARAGDFDRQPAEFLQQIYHRRRKRQRRRVRSGRHICRARRGAGASGGHQERRKYSARRHLRIFPQQPVQHGKRIVAYRAAAHSSAVRRQPFGSIGARQDFVFRELRGARLESVGAGDHRSIGHSGDQCTAQKRGVSRAADLNGRFL